MSFFYLATSYTRRPSRSLAFSEAAALCARLATECNIIAFSPIAHGHPMSEFGGVGPADHHWWLKFHWPFINASSALLVAHDAGWQDSRGMAAEIAAFEAAGKPIFDLDPVSLGMTRRKP